MTTRTLAALLAGLLLGALLTISTIAAVLGWRYRAGA